jgi:hypothetical protein
LFDIEILNNFLFSFQETNNDMKSREPSTWMTQWAALTSKSNKSPSNEMASPRSNPGKTNKIYELSCIASQLWLQNHPNAL